VSLERDIGRTELVVRVGLLAFVPLAVLAGTAASRLAPFVILGAYVAVLAAIVVVSRRLRDHGTESEYLALHDPVTELPNRVLFHDRMAQAIALADRRGTTAAVLLMDLDRFKEVNDTLGHHNGDLLLTLVASRLREALRASDTVARLGGDEFAVLVPEVSGPEAALEVATKMAAAISRRFDLDEVGLEVEASIGIALYPHHGGEPEILLQRADVAMYEAKRARAGHKLYSAERDGYSLERLELIADLRGAIDNGELVVHFQPKADLRTGTAIGVEALVRWNHPRRGLLPPGEFLPSAEGTGLIRPLTLSVLESALAQIRAWRDDGFDLSVAVNLSTRNLLDLDLPERVHELLERTGVEPESLELEITESMIMSDPVRAKAVLDRLSEMGVGLAIDDFGTGYSSFHRLADLPVTTLKVDKSFVLKMDERERDAIIVKSTVQLAHNLGLNVVAEGVESAAVWRELAALGCHQAQGFYLSRPTTPELLTPWLREHARSGSASSELATVGSVSG
jgi:diguanylate cyclase (GGDEF)-like protein